mgnify:CR=1 FL=1
MRQLFHAQLTLELFERRVGDNQTQPQSFLLRTERDIAGNAALLLAEALAEILDDDMQVVHVCFGADTDAARVVVERSVGGVVEQVYERLMQGVLVYDSGRRLTGLELGLDRRIHTLPVPALDDLIEKILHRYQAAALGAYLPGGRRYHR